jgi:asparagine synthase (glutamine-hydrolysing)
MCRIAGIIDSSSGHVSADTLMMRDSMKHGGPDHAGLYLDKHSAIGFGHRRLSIIDLCETGNQPMFNVSGNIALVFNGEIYNYLELKKELSSAGHTFSTHSDTEVILKAYEQWGTDCFARFRGMFAIALHDQSRQEIVLARDHAGIKPLYYSIEGSRLYFASEIRAFRELKPKWEENPDWKVYFLTYGYLPDSITTLKGVSPLEKGSFIILNTGSGASRQVFFSADQYESNISDPEEARALIRQTLEKAVERHLIADAPLGIFLSGGIDSSLISLIAKKYKEELHTLSIVFDDPAYSEKSYQDLIVKKINSTHQSFLLDRKIFVDAIPDIFRAMDQPSSDGINSYFISKFAREAGLKAVLSGLGADEFFGGYSSFKRTGIVRRIRQVPGPLFEMARLFNRDKYKKISFLRTKDSMGEYLFNRGYFTPLETARLLDMNASEVRGLLRKIELPDFVNDLSDGNRVSFLESNLYMQNQLLRDTDVMSMWHSIEVRVPFLDYDVIRAVQQVSSALKFDNAQGKFLLIDAFRDLLPREIWDRKKQGFVFPFNEWMKGHVEKLNKDKQSEELTQRFRAGKLSWSRYWTYLISQEFAA